MTQFRRPSPWVVPGTKLARRKRPRGRFCPRLDVLEGRALLATLTVMNAADAGPGSLRQAILDANAAPGADVVCFDGGLDGATITLSSGPLPVTDDVTIDGPGASRLAVSGGDASTIFATSPAAAGPSTPPLVVTIAGLTLAHGLASGFAGGAISAQQTDLTLEDCVVEDSVADVFGGGLYVVPGFFLDPTTGHDVFVPGALTIDGCTFRGNRADDGGAIKIFSTPTTVRDSTFQGNSVRLYGGAINSTGSDEAPASLHVSGSVFLDNSCSSPGISLGGAISHNGELTVDDSLFVGNQARGASVSSGGAIHRGGFFSSLTVTGSTFRDNSAVATNPSSGTGQGGAIGSDFGGAMTIESMTIDGSWFQGNRAEGGRDAFGGAVQCAGSATIIGSTFLGNVARGRDDAGFLNGGTPRGGAVASGGALTLADSTFLGNQAIGGASPTGFGGWSFGGGVAHLGDSMTVTGTLFAGNLARAGDGGLAAGTAAGGGLCLAFSSGRDWAVSDSLFLDNQAAGGAALGAGVTGGTARGGGLAIVRGRGTLNLRGVVFAGGLALGGRGGPGGGAGGDALGGGLDALSKTVVVDAGLFVANQALGGASPGGPAGAASGGAISSQPDPGQGLTVRATALVANRARGGSGASGGDARGGGLFASGTVLVEDSLVAGNRADAGPAGSGYGGGIFLVPGTTATIRRTRVFGNRATTADDQISGSFTP